MHASTRNVLRALLLGCMVLWATAMSSRLLLRELDPSRYPIGEDGISVQVARFEPLWRELGERGIRRVGFVTDATAGRSFRDAWFIDHHIARYALRPLIVRYSAEEDYVVGSFADTGKVGAIATAAGLVVEKDYGHGILLLRREGE